MQTPRIHLAYAPRAGLGCVIAYLVSHRDVYGWIATREDGTWHTSYFILEDYYTPRKVRALLLAEDELHTGVIDEGRSHELAQLRDFMEHEWLFRSADPSAASELEAYARAELAAGDLGIRFARLGRLSKVHATWTYYSAAFESGVLDCLAKRLRLHRRAA